MASVSQPIGAPPPPWLEPMGDPGRYGLDLLGMVNEGNDTICLIGPEGAGFWPFFTASVEFTDGFADPLDRWSKRVIGGLADQWEGTALFPSDGPPYPPFLRWALTSGEAWSSPVGMLVHDRAGLWSSYRGAIRIGGNFVAPLSLSKPCDTCVSKPCLIACPVNALGGPDGYDVPACKSHLSTNDTASCMQRGCAARRACPVGENYGRMEQQSAFHMQAFME